MAKVSTDTEDTANEIKVIKSLAKYGAKNVTSLIDYDIIIIKNFENDKRITCGYIIMPRYEKITTCPITAARHLVRSLEVLHTIGRVHNDIKPENAMTTQKGQTVLIDFGMSEKFSDEDTVTQFQGNLLFASLDKLHFRNPTRKDDLVSLAYMMMYMINN